MRFSLLAAASERDAVIFDAAYESAIFVVVDLTIKPWLLLLPPTVEFRVNGSKKFGGDHKLNCPLDIQRRIAFALV